MFANDEQFAECRRPDYGEANREINRGAVSLLLSPRPLADFGLEYEALWSGYPYPFRCSDSGGRWTPDYEEIAFQFSAQADVDKVPQLPTDHKQLHLLIHPDWWADALLPAGVYA
jgi:hypothetical protein